MPAKTVDLDLRGAKCPMAFVKARLFLDALPIGQVCTMLYEENLGNEPLVRSIKGLGHHVEVIESVDAVAHIQITVAGTAKSL